MSFVRTLATLAVGFAAARGMDKYRQGGGMDGLRDSMKSNPQTAGMANQLEQMFGKFAGGGGLGSLGGLFGGGAGRAGGGGLGGLLGALGGLGATASANMTGMMDQITGTTTATDAAEANARLMIRAMIQAAKADGKIDETERATIMEHLAEATPEERAFVDEQMNAPLDAMALARDTADAAKTQVYSAAAMTVRTDGPAEQQFLATLARALGLDAQTVAGIHLSVGKAAPKA